MIKVIDNIVSDKIANEIEDIMTCVGAQNFNWFFNKGTLYPSPKNDNFQLTHLIYYDENDPKITSAYFDISLKILENIKFKKIYRIKANLNTNISNYKKGDHNLIHQDVKNNNFKSLLYYVNDTDGDTFFFKNKKVIKKVKPKKNRAVFFNSNIEHAGSNPIKSPYRMVINFILEV